MASINSKYQRWFDDPYKILAQHLVSRCSIAEMERLMVDDEFIYRIVVAQIRSVDFNAPVADCIFHEQAHGKKRMELMHAIDRLADYFYSQLDLPRLRREVKSFCSEIGIFLEEPEETV